MSETEIKDEVRKIVATVLKHENFEMKDELKASDVDGWDSLTHMMIIAGIEKKMGIRFKLKDLNKLNNMGDLLRLVTLKIAEAQ